MPFLFTKNKMSQKYSSSILSRLVDYTLLLGALVFLAVFFDIRYLFHDTIVTGGDTASWQAAAHHMLTELLPRGRLMGWDMGNFAGYPHFNFYFIPPFLLAALPAWLFDLPLTITLKWAIMSGIFIFPLCVYFGLRKMDYPFPVPITGTYLVLVLFFNETYTMFGGNTLSTFAGEFGYMLAFALLPLFMGMLYRGVRNNTGWITNGFLLGFIGLTHLFVFIPAGIMVMYLFFTSKRPVYLVKVSLSAFGLMAFWLVPLLAFRDPYTTPVYMIWTDYLALVPMSLGLGLIMLVLTPMLAARAASSRDNSLFFRDRALFCMALGGLVFSGFVLIAKFILFGADMWNTGLGMPGASDAIFNPALALTLDRLLPGAASALAVLTAFFGYVCLKKDKYSSALITYSGNAVFIIMVVLAAFFVYRVFPGAIAGKSFLHVFEGKVMSLVPAGLFLSAWMGILFLVPVLKNMAGSNYPDRNLRQGLYLGLIFGCVVTYLGSHYLQVPDIRFLPPILLVLVIILAAEIGPGFYRSLTPGKKTLAAIAICLCCLPVILSMAKNAGNWYRYNNLGYEDRPGYPQFEQLNSYLSDAYQEVFADPLQAPRVAYEKSGKYVPYGGDRAFESLPYFSGRQTLEGIHYASAMGAKTISFLQTEFSKEVKAPQSHIFARMNPDAWPVHFDLYNISQVIVISEQAKARFEQSDQFYREAGFGPLALYKYARSRDRYVEVPKMMPVLYTGTDWPEVFYDWFRHPGLNNILLVSEQHVYHPEDRAVFKRRAGTLDEVRVIQAGSSSDDGFLTSEAGIWISLQQERIEFYTDSPGRPHLIKVSYFPNWRVVSGAHGVYPVSPHFMLVIPRDDHVVLAYGPTLWDRLGVAVSILTLVLLLVPAGYGFYTKGKPAALVNSIEIPLEKVLKVIRPWMLVVILGGSVILAGGGLVNRAQPARAFIQSYNELGSAHFFRAEQDDKRAEKYFKKAIETARPIIEKRNRHDSLDVINCLLISAQAREAINMGKLWNDNYRIILEEFPYSRYVSEAWVRLGNQPRDLGREKFNEFFNLLTSGEHEKAFENIAQGFDYFLDYLYHLDQAIEADPFDTWAGYAVKDATKAWLDIIEKQERLQNIIDIHEDPGSRVLSEWNIHFQRVQEYARGSEYIQSKLISR